MAKQKKKSIRSITVRTFYDTDADTSYIGKFTDDADDWNLDRASGEYIKLLSEDYQLPQRGREYRFFRPSAGGEKPGTKNYQKYGKQDLKRMESLCRNDWCHVGIRATAEIVANSVIQTIQSPGLWGIELTSSSDENYLNEIRQEELNILTDELRAFGFSLRKLRLTDSNVTIHSMSRQKN